MACSQEDPSSYILVTTGSSYLVMQDPDSEAEAISLETTMTSKRERSATLQANDEAAVHQEPFTPPSKRQRLSDASPLLLTPISSLPPVNFGRARANISPTTETVIRQMPIDIKKAIKTLETIRNSVEGLLEFKAILDYKQIDLEEKLAVIERNESLTR